MATVTYNPKELRRVVEEAAAILAEGGYYNKGADKLTGQKSLVMEFAARTGVSHQMVRRQLDAAEQRLGLTPEGLLAGKAVLTEQDLEALPDGLEVLTRHADHNTAYVEAMRRKRVRVIPVRPEPFGIGFIGDPHLDNKGTDLALLKRDMDLLRATGTRAINMGDLLDNFHHTGKLAAKQASNRVSATEALGMARWFVRDSGVKFDAHLLGNHDHWPGDAYATMLQTWASEAKSRLYDWVVKLVYQWEGGSFTVLAAHDFKGNSIHNPLHGLFRRAMEDGTADLYVAGHRHTAAQSSFENGFRERRYHFVRVKGYKAWDEYAHVKGFPQQVEGASALVVVDPLSTTMAGRVRVFEDIAEGMEYLSLTKQRYANG